MKFDKTVKKILDNVYMVNRGLVIDPRKFKNGKTTVTAIHDSHGFFVTYNLPEKFEHVVTIGDMSKFLGILSSFNNPEIKFSENFVEVKDGTSSVKLVYSSSAVIFHPIDELNKRLKYEDGNVIEFNIAYDTLHKFLKSSHVLGLKDIRLISDGTNVSLSAENIDNPSSDACELKIDGQDVVTANPINVTFDKSFFNFIDGEYNIKLKSIKGVSDVYALVLTNKDVEIEYTMVNT